MCGMLENRNDDLEHLVPWGGLLIRMVCMYRIVVT